MRLFNYFMKMWIFKILTNDHFITIYFISYYDIILLFCTTNLSSINDFVYIFIYNLFFSIYNEIQPHSL